MKLITARPHRLLDACISRIGELASNGERSMLLVPTQYTLQAEIEVMSRLKMDGSFLINVLSPSRLRSRIFEYAGQPDRVIIDQRGKCMVIGSILEQEKENLNVYKLTSGAPKGLCEKISSTIAALKRSEVTPEDLKNSIDAMPENTAGREKLIDVQRIYASYEDRLWGKLADDEDIAREMRKRMKRSGVLDDQHIFVYGFDVITPDFAEDLLFMEPLAKSITLAIETDKNSAPDGRLFAPVNESIDRLSSMASEQGIKIEREVISGELNAPKDIQTLESGLFALGAAACTSAPTCIELSAAGTPRAEIHAAASRIRTMIAKGEDPADMAIVYPKGNGFGALLENILPMYDLNVYVAEKRSAASNPLCRFLLSALAVISDGWRTADIIECIQSGFLPISEEEADALCSYAEGVDLRGDAWKHEFTYIKNGTKDMLDALNSARTSITAPLTSLSKRISSAKSAEETISALIHLLDEVCAFDKLEQMRDELKAEGQEPLAEDCAQVWNHVMETFDQLHTLLGGEKVSAGTILELLKNGISAIELSALPPVDGAIICGEIGNVRTAQIKTLFAIGMNDAAGSSDQSLLTPQETEEAERATNAYFGMRAAQREALAQLDILKTLSGTKEKLLISYALSDETGRALRESSAVTALRQLFSNMPVRGGLAQEDLKPMLTAPQAAVQALSIMLGEAADGKAVPSGDVQQVYAALSATEEGRDQLIGVTRRLTQPVRPRLDGTQARTLYGRPVMSVSRLETFAQCPYKHFISYGLSPIKEIQPGVDRAEVGTLYHEAAEQFTRIISAHPDFPRVSAQLSDETMQKAIAPLIEQWRQSPLGKSKRGEAIAAKLEKTAKRTGRNIVSQYAGGSFHPMRSEMIFGQGDLAPITLELADGTVIFLQGRIDRVDVMDGEKIRIIDYKSGTKKFDPTMAYWGLQLQLMIYLAAALSRIPGSSAAGFFYCRIADPLVRSESRIKEEIEKQLAKKLSLAGISLSDVAVLRAHGESHASMITKDGKPSGRHAGSMVDEAGMQGLIRFAKEKASALAQEAYRGVIDDAPAEYRQFNACGICDYAAICGFDPSRSKSRRLTGKKLEDLTGQA